MDMFDRLFIAVFIALLAGGMLIITDFVQDHSDRLERVETMLFITKDDENSS